MQINSLKCSFVRLARYFDFTNFITEKKYSPQYVVLKTERRRALVYFSFECLCSVTCSQNSTVEWHLMKFFRARSSGNLVSSVSAADTSVTKC